MIVKNETHVIRQCLDSVAPFVDYVLICDTGSSDGTQDLCRAWCAEHQIAGEVYQDHWRDFASNRSRALELLRSRSEIDYALIMDADDVLHFDPQTNVQELKAKLDADIYMLNLLDAGVSYQRVQLVRNHQNNFYRGVLHEFLVAPENAKSANLQGLWVESRRLGARNKDPEKYIRDAEVLEKALLSETDEFMRARYTFYLAQSYKDAGDRKNAIIHYRQRALMGFWQEEVFISLYRVAQLMEAEGASEDNVLQAYKDASAAQPSRLEALHGAARLCRLTKRYDEGYRLALAGLFLAKPVGGLFVENWIYDFAFLDEFAVLAYWAGHYRESLDACCDLLMRNVVPAEHVERVRQNAIYARGKVPLSWALSAS